MHQAALKLLIVAIGITLSFFAAGQQAVYKALNQLGYYDDRVDLYLESDLSIATPVSAGSNIEFTLTVGNRGPADATQTEVLLALSSALTIVATDCVLSSDVACDIGDLPTGTEASFNFVVQVDSFASDVLDLGFVALSFEQEDYPGDEQLARAIVAERITDLEVEIDSATFAGPNQPIEYWLSARNLGPSSEPSASVSFIPDPALTNVSWDCFSLGGSQCDSLFGQDGFEQMLLIPPGGEVLYRIEGTTPTESAAALISWSLIGGSGIDDNFANDSTMVSTRIREQMFASGFE